LLAGDLQPAKPQAEQADTDQDHAEQADAEQPAAEQDQAGQADSAQSAGGPAAGASGPLSVYGDSAYGTGEVLDTLEQADAEIYTQTPTAPDGRFAKDKFAIDLDAETVTCPAAHTVALTGTGRRRVANFASLCADCPLANQCTSSKLGRTSNNSHAPGTANKTPSGPPTTTPPAPRSSAKPLTSRAADTAAAAPACAANPKS
jgi:hypothetical protein